MWGLPMGFPGMAAGALTATTQTVLQGPQESQSMSLFPEFPWAQPGMAVNNG